MQGAVPAESGLLGMFPNVGEAGEGPSVSDEVIASPMTVPANLRS